MPDHDDNRDSSSRWTRLGAGTLTEVRTDGRHVRRPTGPWSEAVHDLLRCLEHRGVDGVPRVVRVESDMEILAYLPGTVVRRPWPVVVQSECWMEAVGAWLRTLHEATAGFRLSYEGASFAWGPASPEPGHVITHGDFGPWNMLSCGGRFAGVIDWDLARFGRPLDDLAEASFELGPLRPNREMLVLHTDEIVRTRIEALCHGYGGVEVDAVIEHVAPFYEARIAEIKQLAGEGRAPFVALSGARCADALADDLRSFRERWTHQGTSE